MMGIRFCLSVHNRIMVNIENITVYISAEMRASSLYTSQQLL